MNINLNENIPLDISFFKSEKFFSLIQTFSISSNFADLLFTITHLYKNNKEISKEISQIIFKFIEKNWDEAKSGFKSTIRSIQLGKMIKIIFELANENIFEIINKIIEEMGKEPFNIGTLKAQTYTTYLKYILEELNKMIIKLIPTKNAVYIIDNRLELIGKCVEYFTKILDNTSRFANLKGVHTTVLKGSKAFIQTFVLKAMRLFQQHFVAQETKITEILKTFQSQNIYLQSLCDHHKIKGEKQTLKIIPQIKKHLDMFVSKVSKLNSMVERRLKVSKLEHKTLDGHILMSQMVPTEFYNTEVIEKKKRRKKRKKKKNSHHKTKKSRHNKSKSNKKENKKEDKKENKKENKKEKKKKIRKKKKKKRK
ncbi:fanconi anemia group d2 protein [Anaeramoeba ignava]|uniref:Fanconi anemia group d2 protein n=1 Tax=Anaeramoeba ignava TaxID=1746090 RepID=A0A9Q0LBI5_ANAIG|nr:fanconi anemia group d2 protein [Anaeramoeba ignava]